jgi:hypothetical protein
MNVITGVKVYVGGIEVCVGIPVTTLVRVAGNVKISVGVIV